MSSPERRLLRRTMNLITCYPESLLIQTGDMDLLPSKKLNNVIKEIEALLSKDEREDDVDVLRNLRDLQGVNGTWDHCEYMRGLYNGLEVSLSIFENRDPVYKDSIDKKQSPKLSKLDMALSSFLNEHIRSVSQMAAINVLNILKHKED